MEKVTLRAPSSCPGIEPEKEKVRLEAGGSDVESAMPAPGANWACDAQVRARTRHRNMGMRGAWRFIKSISWARRNFPGCVSGDGMTEVSRPEE